jgi:hypothetical protein
VRYGVVGVVGAVGTVTVLVGLGAVTVRVGVCTVTLVVLEVVTVEVTGFVAVLALPPLSLPFVTASAIPTPAASATMQPITIGQTRDFRGRISLPHVGQKSAPGGTLLPQFGQRRGWSGGSCRVGSSVMSPSASKPGAGGDRPTHPVRMILCAPPGAAE